MRTWGSAHVQAAKCRTWSPARNDRALISREKLEKGETYTSLPVQGLDHQDERRRSDFLGGLLVHDVQGRFVNQTNVQSLLTETQDSIVRPVQDVTEGHDVSGGTLEDSLVLSGRELVTIAEEFGPIGL